MPVQLMKIIKGQSEAPLPSHLQKENLQHLKEGCDHTNKYVQGVVTLSYPLTKLRDGTDFFKIVLQDSDNLFSQINSINVLIYGKMAEDCAKIIRRGPVKRLSLCNSEVSSDRGEQGEKSPVLSSNPDSATTSQNLVHPTF